MVPRAERLFGAGISGGNSEWLGSIICAGSEGEQRSSRPYRFLRSQHNTLVAGKDASGGDACSVIDAGKGIRGEGSTGTSPDGGCGGAKPSISCTSTRIPSLGVLCRCDGDGSRLSCSRIRDASTEQGTDHPTGGVSSNGSIRSGGRRRSREPSKGGVCDSIRDHQGSSASCRRGRAARTEESQGFCRRSSRASHTGFDDAKSSSVESSRAPGAAAIGGGS
jgi:hypothetical protein